MKAIAYARYSSNNQREESIDAQFRAIREYCDKNNIVLVETFADEAMTGKNDDREDFQNMIKAVLKGRIKADAILVHKFNRFARNKIDSAIHKKRLKDIGVRVISVTQPIDDSPEGALLESLIEAMDEYYSANLAAEVRKGLRENALKGKHAGGQVLFGYDLDKDGYYVPNENAPVVKRIFEEFAGEHSKAGIIKRLNEEGFKNQRGKTFNVRTIYDILRNEKYIGNFIYTIAGMETIRLEGIIPAIIDRDLWNKVQDINSNVVVKRYGKSNRVYYLTGKIFCGICGSQMCGNGSRRMRNGDLYYYYRCVGKMQHKNGCSSTSLNKDWLEPRILQAVVNEVLSESGMRKIAKLTFDEISGLSTRPKLSSDKLKAELSRIKTKQEKITDLYLDGEIDKSILDRKNEEINRRKFEIEQLIQQEKIVNDVNDISAESIYEFIKSFADKIKNDHHEKSEDFMRAVFAAFVQRITVNENDITITLRVEYSALHNAIESVGDSVRITGVFRRLPPCKFSASVKRKFHIKQRNIQL